MLDAVANVEAAEHQINAFIERRAGQNDKANLEEMMWKESTRKHNAKLRTERLHDRLGWHRAMIDAHTRTFEALLRRHRTGLRLVERELGITTNEGDAA